MKAVSMSSAGFAGIIAWLFSIMLVGSSCSDGNGGEEEENIAQLYRHWEASNNRTPEILDEIWAPTFKYHYNSDSTPTDRNIRSFFNSNVINWPDFVVTPELVMADGDMVGARVYFEGTSAQTGEYVKIILQGFVRFENHKIVELWELEDYYTLIQQQGYTCTPP